MDMDYMEKKYPEAVKAAKARIDAMFGAGAMSGIKYPERSNAYIEHDFSIYRTCYSPQIILWKGDDVEILKAVPLEKGSGNLYDIVEAGTGVDPAGLHEWSYRWYVKLKQGVKYLPLWRTYPTQWEHYAPGYVSKSLRETGRSVSNWEKAAINGIIPFNTITHSLKWNKEQKLPIRRVKNLLKLLLEVEPFYLPDKTKEVIRATLEYI